MLYTERVGYKQPPSIEQQKRDEGWYYEDPERTFTVSAECKAQMKVIMEDAKNGTSNYVESPEVTAFKARMDVLAPGFFDPTHENFRGGAE
jgi:hypothetical protein